VTVRVDTERFERARKVRGRAVFAAVANTVRFEQRTHVAIGPAQRSRFRHNFSVVFCVRTIVEHRSVVKNCLALCGKSINCAIDLRENRVGSFASFAGYSVAHGRAGG